MSRRERESAGMLPLILAGMAILAVFGVALRIAYVVLDGLGRRVSK